MAETQRGAGAALAWEPVRTDTLSWRIVSQIRDALFSGQIHSGDFIGTESSLAQQFGVSRMSVRDALQRLAAGGIVVNRTGAKGGAWVAEGNAEHFADALAIQLKLIGVTPAEIVDAQIAVETTSAELAARVATPEDLGRLRNLQEQMANVRSQPEKFAAAALDFHMAIVEASHNRVLLAQFKAMRHVLHSLHTQRTTPEIADRAVAEYSALVRFIESGDADAARAHMDRRLRGVRDRARLEDTPTKSAKRK